MSESHLVRRSSQIDDTVALSALDDFAIGVLDLDSEGKTIQENPAAVRLLEGIPASKLAELFEELRLRVQRIDQPVSGILEEGPLGAIRLQASRTASGVRLLLEQSYEARLRNEVDILRGLLAAARRPTSPAEALEPALGSLARALGGPDIALFALDAAGSSADCVVAVGQRLPRTYLKSHPVGPWTSVIGRTLFTQGPVHLAQPLRGPFPAERDLDLPLDHALLALPVRVRDGTGGVLLIAGPGRSLHAGAMRLALGLADAFGTLLERTLRDRELQREHARRRQLLDHLPDAVLELDDSGRVAEAAGRVESVLGRGSSEVQGLTVVDLVQPADRPRLSALLNGVEGGAMDASLVMAGATERVVELTIAPRGPSRLVVIRDVTSRRLAQRELEHARQVAITQDRRAALGQLLACINHEINNPLAYIKAGVDLLPRRVEELARAAPGTAEWTTLVDEMRDASSDALAGIERIVRVVRALKGMSRTDHDNDGLTFNPTEPIRDAVLAFQGAKRVECTVDLELTDLPYTFGSPSAVGQVMLNLLENALDASGGRGRLRVEARSTGTGSMVRVTDQGSGIPEGFRAHIFEPYFTTKPIGKGTGLGLYVCRELLNQMGGTIAFETSASGTTFIVELPEAA